MDKNDVQATYERLYESELHEIDKNLDRYIKAREKASRWLTNEDNKKIHHR